MARRPRIVLPGIPLHIIQRGNNRDACFFTDSDYLVYLEWLEEAAIKSGCAVHAYVLMTNHVHLLITPNEPDSAGLMMKQLGQRYVQYINRTYQRSGTLWDGRYRSCLTQEENYVLSCYRYIELNPVRAKMVAHPSDYRWSSCRANAYGETSSLLVPHESYLAFGSNQFARQACYLELLSLQLAPNMLDHIRAATNGNFVLGNKRFEDQISAVLNQRVVPGKSGRPVETGV